MMKVTILTLFVVCVAVSAGARSRGERSDVAAIQTRTAEAVQAQPSKKPRRRNNRQQPDLPEILENAAVPTVASRKSGRKANADATTILEETRVEKLEYPSAGLNRRSRGGNGGGRLVGKAQQRSENQIADDAAAGGVAAESSLRAIDRDLDSVQALLQRKEARQERLDAKAQREARRRDAQRSSASDQLAAASDLAFQTYDQGEEFNNLDASAVRDAQSSVGFQFVSDNSLKEAADISQSSGARAATGTQLQFQDRLEAQSEFDEAILSESAEQIEDSLNAEIEIDNALNAAEESRVASEAAVDAQQSVQAGASFRSSDDFFGGRFGTNRGVFGSADFF